MSVSMVALSSRRMLTVAGILIYSTSRTGSRDYNIADGSGINCIGADVNIGASAL